MGRADRSGSLLPLPLLCSCSALPPGPGPGSHSPLPTLQALAPGVGVLLINWSAVSTPFMAPFGSHRKQPFIKGASGVPNQSPSPLALVLSTAVGLEGFYPVEAEALVGACGAASSLAALSFSPH